jgi:sec-independent protein translocase protein TatB
MFGLGMGEIILIAVVALLVLGPERLPGAAKAIGKGIRDLRAQTKDLQQTIEKDTQIGDAVRELRGALRGDPETLYKKATGEDFRDKPTPGEPKAPETGAANPASEESPKASAPTPPPTPTPPPIPTAGDSESPKAESVIDEAFANTDDGWGQPASNPHDDSSADADLPVIRTPAGTMARGEEDDSSDDQSHG